MNQGPEFSSTSEDQKFLDASRRAAGLQQSIAEKGVGKDEISRAAELEEINDSIMDSLSDGEFRRMTELDSSNFTVPEYIVLDLLFLNAGPIVAARVEPVAGLTLVRLHDGELVLSGKSPQPSGLMLQRLVVVKGDGEATGIAQVNTLSTPVGEELYPEQVRPDITLHDAIQYIDRFNEAAEVILALEPQTVRIMLESGI